jgi:hypothetical protein
MSRAVSISARRRYGLARACRCWRVSPATLHRHLAAANRPDAPPRRRGPMGAMSDADLASRIRALLAATPFYGEGYRKLWARLRHAGVRTSPRRVLRVMRDHNLLAHQRTGSPRGPRAHDGTITTARVDEMWGTDMTSVATGEGPAAVFIETVRDSVPWRIDYAIGKRSSNMMASWLLTACHSRTERFHSVEVAFSAR